jgi:hypothetical protein
MLVPSDQDIQRALGIHRVLEPPGSLPQPAWKLDNTPVAQTGETLVNVQDVIALGVADVIVQGDATQPLELVKQARNACRDGDFSADLTINVVNVPNSEFASILLTKPDGRILFFSMATSFTVAALGAEGIARQVEMHIGNGYMPDCGATALQLLRDFPALLAIFNRRFPERP